MGTKVYSSVPIVLVVVFASWCFGAGVNLPNLTEECFQCLCYVSTKCDQSATCVGGNCGPFNISRIYWADAGKVTLSEDDPERHHAWQDCARSYSCAKNIILRYLQKFATDCNGDGVIDCFDYMMVNGNGGYGCTTPLNKTSDTRNANTPFDVVKIKTKRKVCVI